MERQVAFQPGAYVMAGGAEPPGGDQRGCVELLVLQATPFCNIDCSYCYLPDRGSRVKMAIAVAAAAIDRLKEAGRIGETLEVLWHAGEPLVLPIQFYETMIGVIGARLPDATRVVHSFQTNATLVDDAWCAFFVRHGVRVGVSIDGPPWLHDRHRKTRGGRGTHAAALAGLRKLRDAGLDVGIISVVTKETLSHADALMDFYLATGTSRVNLSIEEIEGINRASSLGEPGCEDLYRAFLARVHERALAVPEMRVRELDHAFKALLAPPPVAQPNQLTRPFAVVTVAANGDVSTFSPEMLGLTDDRHGRFIFGNVLTDSLAAIEGGAHFRRVAEEIDAGVERCRASCGYFDVCGGGSPSNKLCETGRLDATETMYCRFHVILPTLLAVDVLEKGMPNALAIRPGAD